ncbi:MULTISPECIES: hypothetical protein [unclassified Streptomyces]|uniref:hypothetical protein n=1 Tax=unclassified Streptomyces TaxID=2593676 RepID=UPI00278C05AE|nr:MULTISPECIES: hypothetical protein [unclassified Streptomyces]
MSNEIHSSTSAQEAPDVRQVLSSNYRSLAFFAVRRLLLCALLIGGPVVAINVLGVPNTFWTVIPIVPGMFLAIYAVFRLSFGVRLLAAQRVLQHFPLTYCPQVMRKGGRSVAYGRVFTLKASAGTEDDAPLMLALNASGTTKWSGDFEQGAWVAGDPLFGGVLVSPKSHTLMFMKPVHWDQLASRRAELSADRHELAMRAGLDNNKWRQPPARFGVWTRRDAAESE